MWSRHMCKVAATEHRIELNPGTKPSTKIPYRQWFPMREKTSESVKDQLDGGLIEPTAS